MSKKILVIQFSLDKTREHAQLCLRESCPDAELTFINAVENDVSQINPEIYDGVILGGSGQYYLSNGDGLDSWLAPVFKFLDVVFEKNIPTIGICFGCQILALYQGGKVVRDENLRQVGSLESYVLSGATTDPIFSNLPEKFLANFGHKDTPINLPSHLVPLTKSDKVPCTAFRVADKKVWGIMFHPELNSQRNKERLAMVPDYAGSTEDLKRFIGNMVKETPEANTVLATFVGVV
jgi:GMP synthase (glutamine-hydrolysing)